MRAFAIATIFVAILVGFLAGGGPKQPAAGIGQTSSTPDASLSETPVAQPKQRDPDAPRPTGVVMALQRLPQARPGTVQVGRGPLGRFTVDGSIAGTTLTFMVDTGASEVALSRNDARRAGIWVTDADFTGRAQTASATVRVASKVLPQLRVGSIELRDVPALVLDVPDAMPLLGQSFLGRIGKVAIEGDTLTLSNP